MIIDNLDNTNTLSIYFNEKSVPKTIGAGAVLNLQNVFIESIRIVSDAATGSWELQPFTVDQSLIRVG